MVADRARLGSVISNLLSNSLKYTPIGRAIELRGGVIADSIAIQVIDTDRASRTYSSVLSCHVHRANGVGIGLYIACQIAVPHGGTIQCDAQSQSGPRFVVSIPIDRHAPRMTDERECPHWAIRRTVRALRGKPESRMPRSAVTHRCKKPYRLPQRHAGRPRRHDDPGIRKSLRLCLEADSRAA
jgi:Histidine kinase-, DNA gyrase B-, and HSP90-like ATPase